VDAFGGGRINRTNLIGLHSSLITTKCWKHNIYTASLTRTSVINIYSKLSFVHIKLMFMEVSS